MRDKIIEYKKCKWYQFRKKRRLKIELIIIFFDLFIEMGKNSYKIRKSLQNYNDKYHVSNS